MRFPVSRVLMSGLVFTAAVCFTVTAQPPKGDPKDKAAQPKEKGQPKDKAGDQKTYQGRVVSVRTSTNRIVFEVRQGDSERIYNLLLADGAKLRSGEHDVALDTFRPADAVTVTTAQQGGMERVVAVTAGAPGGAKPPGFADRPGEPTGGKLSLAYPTGIRESSVLLIETDAPNEVRVGETYDYKIKVTNISKALTLESVQVRQSGSANLETRPSFGAAKPAGKDGKDDAGQAPDAGTAAGIRWTIPSLDPGQSVTLRAPAVAHTEGTVASCFRVSYEPALCVRLKAVKPNLQLTKSAPAAVRFCEAVVYKYAVKNTGSAAAKGVVVTEDLPNGLTTADGKRTITFAVGDLAPGESKNLEAPVAAGGRGSFTSRATARAADGAVVNSRHTTTQIYEADLTVAMTGPESHYVGQPATYTVTVKNEGDAPAPGTTLEVQLDANARFARASAVSPPAGNEKGKPAAAPTPDKDGKLRWNFGTVPVGGTRSVSFVVTGQQKGTLKTAAVVRFACGAAADGQGAVAATQNVQTALLVVPALRLSLVDQSDLIQVGSTVTYTLRVTNQGTGPDTNLDVRLVLPPELEYVDSFGPTKGTLDPKKELVFGATKQIDPGQTLTWNIRAKALKAADVRTTGTLNSDYLHTPVTTTEPTRLVK